MSKVLDTGLSIPVYATELKKHGLLIGRLLDFWGAVWYEVKIGSTVHTLKAKKVKLSKRA